MSQWPIDRLSRLWAAMTPEQKAESLEQLIDETVQQLRKIYGERSVLFGEFQSRIAKAYLLRGAGKLDEAVEAYNEALQLPEQILVRNDLLSEYEARLGLYEGVYEKTQAQLTRKTPDLIDQAAQPASVKDTAKEKLRILRHRRVALGLVVLVCLLSLFVGLAAAFGYFDRIGGTPELIDINTAPAALLETLPGIGEVKAQAIADYREQNGPFKRREDLLNVPGIGPQTYEKIKDLVTVD